MNYIIAGKNTGYNNVCTLQEMIIATTMYEFTDDRIENCSYYLVT